MEDTTLPYLRLKQNGRRGHAVRVYLTGEARRYPELMWHLWKWAKTSVNKLAVVSARGQTSWKEKLEGHKKPVQKLIVLKTAVCLDAGFVAGWLKVKVPQHWEALLLLSVTQGEPLISIKSR